MLILCYVYRAVCQVIFNGCVSGDRREPRGVFWLSFVIVVIV